MNERTRTTFEPIAETLTGRHARVHPVSQVSLTLGPHSDAFASARHAILGWMNRRAGRPLPNAAWSGNPFELEEIGAQRAEAVAIEKPHFWAARFDDADRNVPSRTWVTEIALGQREDSTTVFGTRLTAVERGPDVSFERSIPSFVRQVVAVTGAELDGRKISQAPWLVAFEDDVDALVALLVDPHRRVDVIVAALAEDVTDPRTASVDVVDITQRTIGAAHVAILTGPASFHLSDRVGREFSVFHQAVRTYKPRFNIDLDEPFAHPLGLPHRIADWPDGGSQAYARLIVSQALRRSVSSADSERLVPSFLKVKRLAAEIRLDEARQTGSSDNDLLALYEKDNADLRIQLAQEKDNNDALLVQAEAERDSALEAIQQVRENAKHLRQRIEVLQARLEEVPKSTPIPNTLDNIEVWCEENLAGYVDMHSRSFRGIKNSDYEDASYIYKSLILLRDHYVPMRRNGGADLIDAFRAACRDLGLEEEPTGSQSRAGEEGEEYYVRYGGKRIYLDRHLKKGNSRDRRHCFRLYFFWDDENQQAVVGWLPSHLDSRAT